MTLASWITVSRLFAVPILLWNLRWSIGLAPSEHLRWICAIAFLLAAGTDWLDGYIARRFNQVTDLGKVLDPLVDKILILTPLLCLIDLHEVPAWTVFLILLRELTIAGWRVNQTSVSGANVWGKAKTVSQITAIALLIAPLGKTGHLIGLMAYGVAIALTLISGGLYLWPRTSKEAISNP
jgi:CDP-diacylglycerol---glycerol-3-phosphate 3-phosphatidyltransferase